MRSNLRSSFNLFSRVSLLALVVFLFAWFVWPGLKNQFSDIQVVSLDKQVLLGSIYKPNTLVISIDVTNPTRNTATTASKELNDSVAPTFYNSSSIPLRVDLRRVMFDEYPLESCSESNRSSTNPRVLSHFPKIVFFSCSNPETNFFFLLNENLEVVRQWTSNEKYSGVSTVRLVSENLSVFNINSLKTEFRIQDLAISDIDWAKKVKGMRQYYAVVYDHTRKVFYLEKSSGDTFHNEGGVYELQPSTGNRQLLIPRKSRLLYTRLVKDLDVSEDGRYLYVSIDWSTRGPGRSGFLIYDLVKRELVFEKSFEYHSKSLEIVALPGDRVLHVRSVYQANTKQYVAEQFSISDKRSLN